ncbi:MAG: hypothetical protein OES47_01945 [Acidobacteriota bacterium]|nr:hypothetical protein [Acidobacteriota bacterium]
MKLLLDQHPNRHGKTFLTPRFYITGDRRARPAVGLVVETATAAVLKFSRSPGPGLCRREGLSLLLPVVTGLAQKRFS